MLIYGICLVVGVAFVGMGIFAFKSKRPMPFWAGVPVGKVEDVKGYNRAVGRMWIVFGTVFEVLCIPLMGGQNTPAVIFSIIGIAFESIAVMGYYGIVIGPKFLEKRDGQK